MSDETKHVWNTLIVRLSPPLIGVLIGAGGSQLLAVQTLRDKVNYNTQHLEHLDKDIQGERDARIDDDRETRQRVADLRIQTEERMKNVATLMSSIMDQNKEVIGLFKMQQQLGKP